MQTAALSSSSGVTHTDIPPGTIVITDGPAMVKKPFDEDAYDALCDGAETVLQTGYEGAIIGLVACRKVGDAIEAPLEDLEDVFSRHNKVIEESGEPPAKVALAKAVNNFTFGAISTATKFTTWAITGVVTLQAFGAGLVVGVGKALFKPRQD